MAQPTPKIFQTGAMKMERGLTGVGQSLGWGGANSAQTLGAGDAFPWLSFGTSVSVNTGSLLPASPPNRLYMFASGSANPPTESFAIIRPFSNLSADTHRLRFKAYATAIDRVLEVGYVTSPTDMSTFVLLESVNLPVTTPASAL
jgi:hypothetical protein